jgi:hypothetical protein
VFEITSTSAPDFIIAEEDGPLSQQEAKGATRIQLLASDTLATITD